jgi:hypothetical protein
VAALDETVAGLVYWSSRDLDASVELDDVVQEVALAQLEAQAAGARPSDATLRLQVQRRARRELWQVRWSRGRQHRVGWNEASLRYLVGPDPGLAAAEELGWQELVEMLGWQDALALWLWAVEDWTLIAIGEWQAITKQQARRRLLLAAKRLRGWLAAEAG